MKLIAHRGGKDYGLLENTLANLSRALHDEGYIGIELDIRFTSDHEFVVIHDAFIDRVTNESGLVKNKTLKELQSLGLCSLKEVLDISTNKIILIEIKDYDMDFSKLVMLLNAYSEKQLYVYSFSNKAMHEVLKESPNFKVGVLNYLLNSEHSYQEYDFVALLKNTVSSDLLHYFASKKIETFVYGIFFGLKIKDISENQAKELFYIVDEVPR